MESGFQKNIQYHIMLNKENKKDMSKYKHHKDVFGKRKKRKRMFVKLSITKMRCVSYKEKTKKAVRRTAHEEPILFRKECSNSEEQFRRNVNNKD